MLENVRADYRRIVNPKAWWLKRILLAFTNYGFLALLVFRFGKAVNRIRIPVVSHILKLVYFILKTLVEILFGISIDVNSNIGPGLFIGHFGTIIIRGDIGRNCSLGQGVTIGSKGAGKSDGWPVLADNVYLGAGCKIIGHIHLGEDVVVGANAVVVRDVPPKTLAAGVPAKHKPIE